MKQSELPPVKIDPEKWRILSKSQRYLVKTFLHWEKNRINGTETELKGENQQNNFPFR